MFTQWLRLGLSRARVVRVQCLQLEHILVGVVILLVSTAQCYTLSQDEAHVYLNMLCMLRAPQMVALGHIYPHFIIGLSLYQIQPMATQ